MAYSIPFLWGTTSTATYNQQPTTTNATTYNEDKMPQAFLDMQERRVDLPSGSSKRGCGGGGDDGWSSRDQQLPRDRRRLGGPQPPPARIFPSARSWSGRGENRQPWRRLEQVDTAITTDEWRPAPPLLPSESLTGHD